MQESKQIKSGLKLSGFVLLLAIIAAGFGSYFSLLILWIFAPVIIVSLILFFVFLYRLASSKNLTK
jgi:CHASE2 domain-containing sensor protein